MSETEIEAGKTWVGEPYDLVLADGTNITPDRSEEIFLKGEQEDA